MSVETYTGSCHCGAIRFEADIDLDEGSNRCNCSYCAKARTWFAFAKGPQRFRLLDGTGVSEYRWTPPGELESHLTFTFCRTCGIRTYARGNLESLGGTLVAAGTLAWFLFELNGFPRISMLWVNLIAWSVFNLQMLFVVFRSQ